MAAKKKGAGLAAAAGAAKSSPYVQRLIEDSELRDNMRVAFDSARQAYGRISNGKATSRTLMEDKKLHKELRNSADALREATAALREGPKRTRRRGGFGRKLLVLAVGGGLAVAISSDLRSKILDALFGKEEEFEYTSSMPAAAQSATTMPTQPVSS